MTNTNGQRPTEAMNDNVSAEEGEIHNLLEARYPNTRRLQRAIIRLAELDPDTRYGSMPDTADPAFQRIVARPEAPGKETGTKAPGPLALKVEPIVVKSSTEAGGVAAPKSTETSTPADPAGHKTPGKSAPDTDKSK